MTLHMGRHGAPVEVGRREVARFPGDGSQLVTRREGRCNVLR